MGKTACNDRVWDLHFLILISIAFAFPTIKSQDKLMVQNWTIEEQNRKKIGLWLKQNYPPDTTIAIRPAGLIPYYSSMKAYDVYCLTNREQSEQAEYVQIHWVGHQLVNLPWIIKQQPNIIILDEHLYTAKKISEMELGDGVIEKQWRNSNASKYYRIVQSEIEDDQWLQYYQLID